MKGLHVIPSVWDGGRAGGLRVRNFRGIPKPERLTTAASSHLDMLRGVAALAVLASHLRGMFLVDFKDLPAKSVATAALYAVTGLGNQAVTVFFVLSGFFIAGSVLSAMERWSWKRYLVNRFSRLYLVLLPALLLTALLDYLARQQSSGGVFFGHPFRNFGSEPFSAKISGTIFLGNVFFLQNMIVPAFGSNGPLWSLANEFWYYMLFPFVALGLFSRWSMVRRLLCGAVAAVLVVWLGKFSMLAGFCVWLFGAAIHFLSRFTATRAVCLGLRLVSWGLFGLVLALSRAERFSGGWEPFAIGFGSAVLLCSIVKIRSVEPDVVPSVYKRIAGLLAGCSYSVYAIHFPVAMLIRSASGTAFWLPSMSNLLATGAISIGIFLAGLLFSSFTEGRTAVVRARLMSLVFNRAHGAEVAEGASV